MTAGAEVATVRDRAGSTSRPPAPVSHRRRRRPGWLRRLITYIVLTPISLIWIYPFIWMISSSVKPNSKIFSDLGLVPTKFFWSNYADAWVNANIGRFFVNSVIVSVGGVIVVVFATSTMGYILGRYSFPGKAVIVGMLAALAILPQGYTIIPVFDLITKLHLDGTLFGIILAESGSAHIIQLLLYAGYFRQLPDALEESAKMDGAGFFRIYFTIFLPLAAPATATVIILQFIASWNDFLLPLVLTLSQPDLQTLAVGIYSFQGQNLTNYAQMSAASTISLVPVIVVFLFFQRYFVEGLAGAVKQ